MKTLTDCSKFLNIISVNFKLYLFSKDCLSLSLNQFGSFFMHSSMLVQDCVSL
jgi:hypothetical protein